MTDMQSLTLGKRIQALRKRQGLTQETLSERMNVTPQAVSKWENDQSCPDVLSLPHLARQLDVTIDMLLTGRDPSALPAEPARSPEELIVRISIQEEDGTRVCINLPFTVFRLGALYGLLTVSYNPADGGEAIDLPAAASLHGVDLRTLVKLIESGVSGKLLDADADGDRLTIWTE